MASSSSEIINLGCLIKMLKTIMDMQVTYFSTSMLTLMLLLKAKSLLYVPINSFVRQCFMNQAWTKVGKRLPHAPFFLRPIFFLTNFFFKYSKEIPDTGKLHLQKSFTYKNSDHCGFLIIRVCQFRLFDQTA